MSKQSINQYYNKIDQYKQFGGTRNELSLRRAFANLLEEYCVSKHLILVDEVHLKGTQKRPDGTVKDGNRFDWGYWESKDPHDNLTEAITEKIALGYPTFNILFENTIEIVLIQHGEERLRGDMRDADRLHRILTAFVEYERPEITRFREAVEQFKQDIPDILDELRRIMTEQSAQNPTFKRAYAVFWQLCKDSINPDITTFDIQEMLNQHILTAEIFDTVFGDSHFHRENNIARELEQVVNTFFTGAIRRNTLSRIENYYNAIKAEASRIQNHHEKQQFLKVVYENFYKAYNPKGADKLGIVYTPNEIVKYMIDSTDYLLDQHFNKSLSEKNVEILDPATGTGTFITAIIDKIPEQYLEYKYTNEIHANEVAILPYYIANLNIEYTYQQKMHRYAPFTNIVFVDTLDNLGFDFQGKQGLFKGFGGSIENLDRIQRQNERKISVILGNPPYNANQMNENENNKNREYFENKTKKTGGVDGRIKETYVRQSTAQKTKVYDMYARFYRWASDRIQHDGIICFITNNSFIEKRTFDGFRKCVEQEFDVAYIIDLGGNIRDLSGKDGIYLNEEHTIFGVSAAVGIAIMFLIKNSKERHDKCKIYYIHPCDIRATRREKFEYLADHPLKQIPFETITPDEKGNWINLTDNDFNQLLSIEELFILKSNGISTNRDEWVYDLDRDNIREKVIFFLKEYNTELDKFKKVFLNNNIGSLNSSEQLKRADTYIAEQKVKIKWSSRLKRDKLLKFKTSCYEPERISKTLYRFFFKQYLYYEYLLIDLRGEFGTIFLNNNANKLICVNGSNDVMTGCFASNTLVDLNLMKGGTRVYPLYNYDQHHGNRIDNITDWGLQQFIRHYQSKVISRDDIFYYTYGVLNNPAYRQKYELNLRREFPRLPFYRNFAKWVAWGKELMNLHINYETVESYQLTLQEAKERQETPKVKLRAIPEEGKIVIDENTTILNIPETAWNYKLGNRSALHWILDQYKEKKPEDKTIAEKFNTYKFADYKDTVIDLLQRVCTVSVKTIEVMGAMEQEEPHEA